MIRLAMPADMEAIAAVQVASWQGAYAHVFPPERLCGDIAQGLRDQWRGYQDRPGDLVLVAEEDGDLLGFAATWCRPDPYLDNLHVASHTKGRGVGRRLMAATAAHLLQRGHHDLWLHVLDSNLGARAFYARMGGTETEAADVTLWGVSLPTIKVRWTDLPGLAAA